MRNKNWINARSSMFAFTSMLAFAVMTAAILTSLSVGGCVAAMSYPEYPGAPKADPSMQPMPNLMADGLKFAHARLAPGTELIYNLPPMTPLQVWRNVGKRLDVGRPMKPGDTLEWSVKQVRLTGARAEVDVVYPTEGMYQLATVHFVGSTAQPFLPGMLQLWLIPVDAPVCNTPQALQDQPKPIP